MVADFGAPGVPVEGSESLSHSHHWLIGRQDGPSSEGVCKACGEVREFTNGFRRSYPGTFRVRASNPARRP